MKLLIWRTSENFRRTSTPKHGSVKTDKMQLFRHHLTFATGFDHNSRFWKYQNPEIVFRKPQIVSARIFRSSIISVSRLESMILFDFADLKGSFDWFGYETIQIHEIDVLVRNPHISKDSPKSSPENLGELFRWSWRWIISSHRNQYITNIEALS